jgi:hypothetical protein
MFGHADDLYKYFDILTSRSLENKFTKFSQKKKFKDNLFFIDNKTIDLYWRKSNVVDRHFDPNTNLSENSLEFNFPDWLKFFYKFNKIKIL